MERLRTIPGGMLIAFVIGVADSLVVWAVAALFDVEILVPDAPGSETLAAITLLQIVAVVAVVSVAAGALLWGLERLTRRALAAFQVIALTVLILSLFAPLMLDQDVEGKLALLAMHLLVGSAVIAAFTWVGVRPGRLGVEQTVQD